MATTAMAVETSIRRSKSLAGRRVAPEPGEAALEHPRDALLTGDRETLQVRAADQAGGRTERQRFDHVDAAPLEVRAMCRKGCHSRE